MHADALPIPLRLTKAIRRVAPTINISLRTMVLFLLMLALALTIGGLYAGGELLLHGNIHDIFIWINAALFIEENLRPHADFSSPLGGLFLYILYTAWNLSINTVDIPIIVGLSFWAVFGILLFAYRDFLYRWLLPVTLLVTLLLAISGRQMGAISVNITWYGSYNRVCWIAIFIFIFVLLGRNVASLSASTSERLRIAFLAGVLLGVTLLIKINFFAAICAIYFGWLIASGAYRDIRAWIIPVIVPASLVATAAILGVDVLGYVYDIIKAADARNSDEAIKLFNPVSFTLAFVLIIANIVSDWVFGHWDAFIRRTILYVGISCGMALGIAGDFSRPLELLVFIIAYRLLDALPGLLERSDRELIAVLAGLLPILSMGIVFASLEFASIAISSIHRLTGFWAHKGDPIVWQRSTNPSRAIRIRFIRPRDESNYNVFAEIAATLNERDRVLRAIANLRKEAFRLTNISYTAQVEEGRDVLLRSSLSPNQVVFPLEFSNPYPFLLGTRPPAGTLLWYHDGTTFNGSVSSSLDAALDSSDIVLVPHVTVDPQMRVVLNTMFEKYNSRSARFCEFHLGLYWSFYRRCTGRSVGRRD